MFGESGACGDPGRETMSVGILARPPLAGARARSCALVRIPSVRGNFLSVAMSRRWILLLFYSPDQVLI
jgi:hypothetical protein